MKADDYRSYVIRVRRHPGDGTDPEPLRLDVEDLLEGGRATVSGESARTLADSLERLVTAARSDVAPAPGSGTPDGV